MDLEDGKLEIINVFVIVVIGILQYVLQLKKKNVLLTE